MARPKCFHSAQPFRKKYLPLQGSNYNITMTNRLTFAALALAGLALSGCKEQKPTNTIITTKPAKPAPKAPVRMQEYTQEADMKLSGIALHCTIHRTPADSVAMVSDEEGQKYVDNEVTLSIRRKDGSVFLDRRFTKSSFDACLDDFYRKRGVLQGFVFDRVDANRALFAASVGNPQSDDEYIPIVVSITPQGAVSMARDTEMDTSGGEADNGE